MSDGGDTFNARRGSRRWSLIDPSPNEPVSRIQFPSGLDFERVINIYSIQATRDRLVQVIQTEQNDNEDPTALLTALSADHLDGIYLLLRNDPVSQLQSLANAMASS